MVVPDAFVIKFDLTKSLLNRAKLLEKLKEFLKKPSDPHAWLFYSLIYNLLGKRLFSIEKDEDRNELDGFMNVVLSDSAAQDISDEAQLNSFFGIKPEADDEVSKELLIQLDDILIEAKIIKKKRSEKEKKDHDKIFGISLNTTFSDRFKTLLVRDGKVFGICVNKLLEQNTLLPPLYFLAPFENVGEEGAGHWEKNAIIAGVLNPLDCIEEYGGSSPQNYHAYFALLTILNCLGHDNLPMETRRKAAALLSIMSINVTTPGCSLRGKKGPESIKIPYSTRIQCSLLSWHTHMYDTDAPRFCSEEDVYQDVDMWLQPIGVNLKDAVRYGMNVRKNLLFFTSESLTTGFKNFYDRQKKKQYFGFLSNENGQQVGFPPLNAENPDHDPTLGKLNILPAKAFKYLQEGTPIGAAVVANAILSTILRKYNDLEENDVLDKDCTKRVDRTKIIERTKVVENDYDVLDVYNVPAVKALCDTIGFDVDTKKFGVRKGPIVPAYFKIPEVLSVYGELLVHSRIKPGPHEKEYEGPQFRESRSNDSEPSPVALPLLSKFLPAALEFDFYGDYRSRRYWVGYHNGEFLEIPKSDWKEGKKKHLHLPNVNLAKFKIKDYGAPLIGVDIASSFKYDSEVTAELVGLPNSRNAGFLVAHSIFEEEVKCLGITSSSEKSPGPVMSQQTVPVGRANIVALPNEIKADRKLKSYPMGVILVVLSCVCDLLSLVGAVALLMLGLMDRDNGWTFVAVASVELTAELLTRIVLFLIIQDRPPRKRLMALFSPIDFTLREDPQEIPAHLWRKPLTIEGIFGLISAAIVTLNINREGENEDDGGVSSTLYLYFPSILVLLLVIVKGQLVTAFIELFNTSESSLVEWKEMGPLFLLSYLASLVTELFLLYDHSYEGAPQDQGERFWRTIAFVAIFANCFETLLAFYALAPISSGTNLDYGSFLITDYPSHIFRGTLGYIPLGERPSKAKRKWATVQRIHEDGGDNFCTIAFVDEDKLKETLVSTNNQNPTEEEQNADEKKGSQYVDEEKGAETEKVAEKVDERKPFHYVPLGCIVKSQEISFKNAHSVDFPISGPKVSTARSFLRAKAKHKENPTYQEVGIRISVGPNEISDGQRTSSFSYPKDSKDSRYRDASMTEDRRLVL